MSAAEGVRFATPKPGSRPITAKPCGCQECRPGPGIDFKAKRKRGIADLLAEQGVHTPFMKYCGECRDVVRVVSIEIADYWSHMCLPKGHTWRTEGKI